MSLKLIEQIEDTPEPAEDTQMAMSLLLTALKALSQRTVIALASLQVTGAIAAVLFVWYKVLLPSPTWPQIAGATLFSGFVLIALWLRR